jgi:Spy/CpxP family protein refolding chaperone
MAVPPAKEASTLLRTTRAWFLLALALATGAALGQQSGGPPAGGPGDGTGPPPMEGRRPPMERAFHLGPHGRWWNNPEFVQKLGLTADQQKKMEAIFEQSRPSLMDLSSSVRKEEMAMEPLLAADQPDEGKILAQIDHVAQARAELEKANARMLLSLRRLLTPDQWKTLQADEPHGHYPRFGPGPPPPSVRE